MITAYDWISRRASKTNLVPRACVPKGTQALGKRLQQNIFQKDSGKFSNIFARWKKCIFQKYFTRKAFIDVRA